MLTPAGRPGPGQPGAITVDRRNAAGGPAIRLPAGTCGIWWAAPAAAGDQLARLLPATERQRWQRFRSGRDRKLYLAAHALARLVAGALLDVSPADLRFVARCLDCGGPHGKPTLPGSGLELSITHSAGRVGVAVSRGVPVGLDVEGETDAAWRTMAEGVLSASEQAELTRLTGDDRGAGFLRYWTRKEALLKATGHGLSVDPAAVTVSGPKDPPALLAWTATPPLRRAAYLTDLRPGSGHVGALALLGAHLQIAEHDGSALLAQFPD